MCATALDACQQAAAFLQSHLHPVVPFQHPPHAHSIVLAALKSPSYPAIGSGLVRCPQVCEELAVPFKWCPQHSCGLESPLNGRSATPCKGTGIIANIGLFNRLGPKKENQIEVHQFFHTKKPLNGGGRLLVLLHGPGQSMLAVPAAPMHSSAQGLTVRVAVPTMSMAVVVVPRAVDVHRGKRRDGSQARRVSPVAAPHGVAPPVAATRPFSDPRAAAAAVRSPLAARASRDTPADCSATSPALCVSNPNFKTKLALQRQDFDHIVTQTFDDDSIANQSTSRYGPQASLIPSSLSQLYSTRRTVSMLIPTAICSFPASLSTFIVYFLKPLYDSSNPLGFVLYLLVLWSPRSKLAALYSELQTASPNALQNYSVHCILTSRTLDLPPIALMLYPTIVV
ncbi:hypothetical protein GGX14DRAFT_388286 [Mycena pura]|uniref:Uncharacterized protein n=1 Tax=Mycena pura TaxID=153505 RepID=A0AAD7E105_9AGAR|nr:hypothetical protein GGX14DRAFT_388286 [Mycena pura]